MLMCFSAREKQHERGTGERSSQILSAYSFTGGLVVLCFSPLFFRSLSFSLFLENSFFFILPRSKYKSSNFLEFLGMFFISFWAVYKLFGAVSPLSLAHFLAVASACYSEHFVSFSYVASRLSRPPHSLASLKPGPVSV